MDFVTSDHHLGHANLIRPDYCNRPFKDADDMDAAMIANWNAAVSPSDTVFVVGDFSFRSFDATQAILSKLNGTKHLIWGNHDRRSFTQKQILAMGFASVAFQKQIQHDGLNITLAHYPFGYQQFVKPKNHIMVPTDNGQYLICGHVHNSWTKRGRMLNVSVDAHDFKPVSLDQAVAMLKQPGDW